MWPDRSKLLRSHWLFPTMGALSALVVTLPAEAAQLQYWRFDEATNQLTFTTDTGVQPKAQLLFNPTRIVVDLPGTRLGTATPAQVFNGAVRQVRVGQFNDQTTRLVIELAEGYTVDPQQVEIRGIQTNQWVVQLPSIQGSSVSSTPPTENTPDPSGASASAANRITSSAQTSAAAQLDGVVATGDGFLIKVSGNVPEPEVEQAGEGPDNRQIVIDLPNTAVAPNLQASDLPDFRYSVTAWDIAPREDDPSTTRITLSLGTSSPDWRALRSSSGVILLPPRGMSISSIPDDPPPDDILTAPQGPVTATIPVPAEEPVAQPPATPSREPLPAVPNERVVVVLDPGHGGVDPGAVGIGGLQEKQVIFPISLRVRELLEEQGVTVVMTRTTDQTLDLQPRVDVAERARAQIFVSIHANAISMSRPDVNGIESYYASDAGFQLASTIHASMLAATGMNDRGVREARFYVIRRTSMPATLLEVGFVTGAQDAPRLADPAWRETMANAIARGILQYIQQYL